MAAQIDCKMLRPLSRTAFMSLCAMTIFRVFFKSGPAELVEADHIGPVAGGVIALQAEDNSNIAFFTIAEIVGIAADKHIKR
jgi:hypothetical protein